MHKEPNWLELIEKEESILLRDLITLLQIPSVREDNLATEDCPLGPGLKEALIAFCQIARDYGFDCELVGNLLAVLTWGEGDEEDAFGILAHVDVVPAGQGWHSPPFEPLIEDGKLFARGALDDKGPLMAMLFAMKLLKEQGYSHQKKIKMIVGSDEERDWTCMKYYQEHFPLPKQGIVPDAYFPIVNGEKGNAKIKIIVGADITSKSSYQLLSFDAGLVVNMVPQEAQARIFCPHAHYLKDDFAYFLAKNPCLKGDIEIEEDVITLYLQGKAAHASKVQEGINAASYLAKFLLDYPFASPSEQSFLTLLGQELHLDFEGDRLGIDSEDQLMGKLSINPGICHYARENGGYILIDCRYPQTTRIERIRKSLESYASIHNLQVELTEKHAPHYLDIKHPMVEKLLQIYEEETGFEAYQQVISGATYARLMPEGVGFGALFPHRIDSMHQADEHIYLEDLAKTTAIYARALQELLCQ